MGDKKIGCSGVRILVGWSCLVGVCEKVEGETGLLLTGCALVGVGLDEPVVFEQKG